MLRTALVLVVMGVAASASAEPCEVEILTAPDDVRPQIEQWVKAEPRCVVKLSVRVIKTEGGLYVLATDASGKSRERVVPDGLTAAVLVASWVADDGNGTTPPPAAPAPPAEVETPPAPAAPPIRTDGPPGLATPVAAPTTLTANAPAPEPRRYFSVGGLVHDHGQGLRAEAYFLRRWKLQFGVAAGWTTDTLYGMNSQVELEDTMITAQVSRRYPVWWRLSIRGSFGVGLAHTSAHAWRFSGSAPYEMSSQMGSPIADGTLAAAIDVTHGFELRLGAHAHVIPQHFDLGADQLDRRLRGQVYAGIGYSR